MEQPKQTPETTSEVLPQPSREDTLDFIDRDNRDILPRRREHLGLTVPAARLGETASRSFEIDTRTDTDRSVVVPER